MANEIWTIKRCLEWTKEYLAERGEEHPRLSAEWLLCAATLHLLAIVNWSDRPWS